MFDKKAYAHRYYLIHKDKLVQCAKEYYLKNKDRDRVRRREARTSWRLANPEKAKAQWQRAREKLRLLVLNYYSNNSLSCKGCGINDVDVLTLDHIANDGAEQRKHLKGADGFNFYRWLKRNGFPKGYQVLCWNCNHKKELERVRNVY